MSDILAITVPLPDGPYPSVNHVGSGVMKRGKKTPEYHELFTRVKEAAEAEIQRVGWSTANYYCAFDIVRYHRRRHRMDAANIGKVESDALTAAGVWEDDKLALPPRPDLEYDPAGPDRIVIVVRKRYPPLLTPRQISPAVAAAKTRKRQAMSTPGSVKEKTVYRGGKIPEGFALVGQELVPRDEAIALITRGSSGRK